MSVLKKRDIFVIAIALFAAVGVSWQGFAQQLFIYPTKGQNAQQQSRDKYECHAWAVQQTGFDPSNPQSAQPQRQAAAPQRQPRRGGLFRGAGRGAALGAVGGAIGGNAGKGAAIGAATGALFGGFRRRDQRRQEQHAQQQYQRQQQQMQQQQAQAANQRRSNYNRAMSACLSGRGYKVN